MRQLPAPWRILFSSMFSRIKTIVTRTFFGVLWTGSVLLAGLCVLTLLSSPWADGDSERRAEVGAERRLQRGAAQHLADAYNRLQARYQAVELTDEQLLKLALARVAKESTVSVEELEATLDSFAVAVEADPETDPVDHALIAFARLDFEAAARLDPGGQREGLRLQGQALMAATDFEGAMTAFESALGVAPRVDVPAFWADLQFRRGEAAAMAGSDGDLEVAIEAFSAALGVFEEDQWTSRGAMAINERAACWVTQAMVLDSAGEGSSESAAAATLVVEAVEAHRAAAEVFHSMSDQRWWVHAKTDLATALRWSSTLQQGDTEAERSARDERLAEAAKALRSALSVQALGECPNDRARIQLQLARVLHERALEAHGPHRSDLLRECRRSYEEAFEVFTHEAYPSRWCQVAESMSLDLKLQASYSQNAHEQMLLLQESLELRLALLDVTPKATSEERWAYMQLYVAHTQLHLFDALTVQLDEVSKCLALIEDAMERIRAVLELADDSISTINVSVAHQNHATALARRASLEEGLERADWLERAVIEARQHLSLYGDDLEADELDTIRLWIDSMESEIDELQ